MAVEVVLKPVDQESSLIPVGVGKTVIGRGPFLLGCVDKKVSRKHAVLDLTDNVFTITATHANPSYYYKEGKGKGEQLTQNAVQKLENGDKFSLLPSSYIYEVIIKEIAPNTSPEPNDNISINPTDKEEPSETANKEEPIKTVINEESIKAAPVKEPIKMVVKEEPKESTDEEDNSAKKKVKEENCIADNEISSKIKEEKSEKTPPPKDDIKENHYSSATKSKRILPDWLLSFASTSSTSSTSSYSITKLNVPSTPVKRTPGRPRKNQESSDTNSGRPQKTSETAESSVGRPRKNQETPKSNAGRPRKNKDTADRNSEQIVNQAGTSKSESRGRSTRAKKLINYYANDFDSDEEEEYAPSPKRRSTGRDDPDYSVKKNSDDSEGGGSPQRRRKRNNSVTKKKRESCSYGAKCYRKNPNHFKEFSHPGESDYSDKDEGDDDDDEDDDEESEKPECEYGVDCYRKNAKHRRDYKHTKKARPRREAAKLAKYNDADEESEDEDFIDDDSDEYNPNEESDDTDDDMKRLKNEAKSLVRNKKMYKA